MYQSVYVKSTSHSSPAEDSGPTSREDHSSLESDNVAAGGALIYRFLSGTIVWLDIIASITVGKSSHLLPYQTHIMASDTLTKFEEIMGCESWVMVLISRIAALQEIKIQAMQQENFNCSELRQDVADIGRQIQDGLALLASESPNISEKDPISKSKSTLNLPRLVTHIFAYMASIYLHLVIEGFQNLETLSTTISKAMRMLQTQIPTQILPALVAPLYLTGSVASQDDVQFFRDIFSSPPVLDPSLAHRGRILHVLEEIWKKRQRASFFAWEDSLELTHDILLI
ncbi:MAG: hypothetical protein Q9195_004996 [Heterodermia aff. obscurata]